MAFFHVIVLVLALGYGVVNAKDCADEWDSEKISELDKAIKSHPVVVVGMEKARCTQAVMPRLEDMGVCTHTIFFNPKFDKEDPEWQYLQCRHPEEIVGDMVMHSYVYIGGEFVGNGFKVAEMTEDELKEKLDMGNADMDCKKDCTSLLPQEKIHAMEKVIKDAPVVLYGWGSCPCTNIARQRFEADGVCYVQTVWPEPDVPEFKYMQCLYGQQHHSFIFFGGEFFGDGFKLEAKTTSTSDFKSLVDGSGAKKTCQKQGDENLLQQPLKSCTQSADGTTTGWTRSGSCNWDPTDGGYHEVCVTMSDEFLTASAKKDANDLSSVVQPGGHWCICAWAFASAVERDPKNYEGIHLECDRTNLKLREVYQSFVDAGKKLTSPSGAAYEAQTALDAVNALCPVDDTEQAPLETEASSANEPMEEKAEELIEQGFNFLGLYLHGLVTLALLALLYVRLHSHERGSAKDEPLAENLLDIEMPPVGASTAVAN